MAQKKIIIFKKGENYGSYFLDGSKKTSWENLTHEEQGDLLDGMLAFYNFYYRFWSKEENKNV